MEKLAKEGESPVNFELFKKKVKFFCIKYKKIYRDYCSNFKGLRVLGID